MALNALMSSIKSLVEFWQDQDISIIPKTKFEIIEVQRNIGLQLPGDFVEFYLRANGMEDFYPNEMDNEGFLFHPVEAIVSVSTEFSTSALANKERIFLFAEYMHRSWWYAFELLGDDDYMIGILEHENSFQPITNSLAEFIELYIADSHKLYG